MSKALRLSEKWFQRGLWLVALAFAWSLIGLGSVVVRNLQRVEPVLTLQQFIAPAPGAELRAQMARAKNEGEAASARLEQARQKHAVALANSSAARASFDNWIATRRATARPDQDPDLIARTRDLDLLGKAERSAWSGVEAEQQTLLDATQAGARASAQMEDLEKTAQTLLEKAASAQELRVFGYRLLLTLPLLAAAAWLFAKKRKGAYWPFVWGFIFFAGFAFFVELVPYLPSYGGYVRYIVGITLVAVCGRQAIVSLQRYLDRQKLQEELPDAQRRATLSYELVLTRLDKSVCPGCERALDLKDPLIDFCPHCGIHLFQKCGRCGVRKGSFAHFCHACGEPGAGRTDATPAP
jgi:predicted RNA-binding Zn-ribbon protein involved in translation (DUF1610 family)